MQEGKKMKLSRCAWLINGIAELVFRSGINSKGEKRFARRSRKQVERRKTGRGEARVVPVGVFSVLGCAGGALAGGFLVFHSVHAYPIPTGGLPPVYWLPLAMTSFLCALAGAFVSTMAGVGILWPRQQGFLPLEKVVRTARTHWLNSPEKKCD